MGVIKSGYNKSIFCLNHKYLKFTIKHSNYTELRLDHKIDVDQFVLIAVRGSAGEVGSDIVN